VETRVQHRYVTWHTDPSYTHKPQYGPICLGTGTGYPTAGASEDCLFVNVYAPANATPDSKLPVWLHITGGGYNAIAGPDFNGTYVIENSGNNLIYVDFNYRVGAFGFLASEKVRANGDLNVGLLDQRKVLQWVQDYIQLVS
jgi:acetylcholinesterase